MCGIDVVAGGCQATPMVMGSRSSGIGNVASPSSATMVSDHTGAVRATRSVDRASSIALVWLGDNDGHPTV